jgi:hypothetical protein
MFAGRKTIEIVRKLMGLKSDDVNFCKMYVPGIQVQSLL